MPNWVKNHIRITDIDEENQERLITSLMVKNADGNGYYMDFNRINRQPTALNIRCNGKGRDGMNAIKKLLGVYYGLTTAESIAEDIEKLISSEAERERAARKAVWKDRSCSAPIKLFNAVELLLACANQPDRSKWPEITPEYREIFKVLAHLMGVHENGLLDIFNIIPNARKSEQERREKAKKDLQNTDLGHVISETRVKKPVRYFAHGLQMALNIVKYGAPDWYDWRVENWGTKWTPEYTEWDSLKSDNMLTIDMETAWSVPEPIIRALSKKYPHAKFEVSYADENTGYNCGRMVYKNGQLISKENFSGTDKGISFACEVWGIDEEEYRAEREEV